MDEGALYRFNWIFPTQKVAKGGIGYRSGYDEAPGGSFAYLDDDMVDAKLVDELRDNPILLIPVKRRQQFLDEKRTKKSFDPSDYIRFGELTEDEVFITEEAARQGVEIAATGSEPLVTLHVYSPPLADMAAVMPLALNALVASNVRLALEESLASWVALWVSLALEVSVMSLVLVTFSVSWLVHSDALDDLRVIVSVSRVKSLTVTTMLSAFWTMVLVSDWPATLVVNCRPLVRANCRASATAGTSEPSLAQSPGRGTDRHRRPLAAKPLAPMPTRPPPRWMHRPSSATRLCIQRQNQDCCHPERTREGSALY